MNAYKERVDKAQIAIDANYYIPSGYILDVHTMSNAIRDGNAFTSLDDDVYELIFEGLGSKSLKDLIDSSSITARVFINKILATTSFNLFMRDGQCITVNDFHKVTVRGFRRATAFACAQGTLVHNVHDTVKKLTSSLNKTLSRLLLKVGLFHVEDGYVYFNEHDLAVANLLVKKVASKIGFKVADRFSVDGIEDGKLYVDSGWFNAGENVKALANDLSNNAWFGIDAGISKSILDLAKDNRYKTGGLLINCRANRRAVLEGTVTNVYRCFRVINEAMLDCTISLLRVVNILDRNQLPNKVRPQYMLDERGSLYMGAKVPKAYIVEGLSYFLFTSTEYYKLESDEAVDIFKAEVAKRYGFFGTLKEQVTWVDRNIKLIRDTASGNHKEFLFPEDVAFKYACYEYLRFMREGIDEFKTNMLCSVRMHQPRMIKYSAGFRKLACLTDDGMFNEKVLRKPRLYDYTTYKRMNKEYVDEELYNVFVKLKGSGLGTRDLVPYGGVGRAQDSMRNPLLTTLLRHDRELFDSMKLSELKAFSMVFSANTTPFDGIELKCPLSNSIKISANVADRMRIVNSAKRFLDKRLSDDTVSIKVHHGASPTVYKFGIDVLGYNRTTLYPKILYEKLVTRAHKAAFTEALSKLLLETYPEGNRNIIVDSFTGIVAGNPNELVKLTEEGLGYKFIEYYDRFIGYPSKSKLSGGSWATNNKKAKLFN